MPEYDYQPQPIEIDLPAPAPGLLRVARFRFLSHHHLRNNVCSARELVDIYTYLANADGTRGDCLNDTLGLAIDTVELKADNDTIVAFPSGNILLIRDEDNPGTPAEWEAQIGTLPGMWMRQGTYFAWLRDHQPLKLRDLIELHLNAKFAA